MRSGMRMVFGWVVSVRNAVRDAFRRAKADPRVRAIVSWRGAGITAAVALLAGIATIWGEIIKPWFEKPPIIQVPSSGQNISRTPVLESGTGPKDGYGHDVVPAPNPTTVDDRRDVERPDTLPAPPPTIVVRPQIIMPKAEVADDRPLPVRTEGRRIMVTNACDSDIMLALVFQLPDRRWFASGRWPIASKETTYLKLGEEFPYDFPVASNYPDVYFHAVAADGRTWTKADDKDNITRSVQGSSYTFRHATLPPGNDGQWILIFSCPNPVLALPTDNAAG